jgi:hypothetical protein
MSLCLTNQAICCEGMWGSECIDENFLDLGTNLWLVFRITHLKHYSPGNEFLVPTRYEAKVGLSGGPEHMVNRHFLTQPGLQLQPLSRPACNQSLY